jgi:hypothetical protein
MHMMIRAKTRDALQNRRAGNSPEEEEIEDSGIGGHSMLRRTLAQINADFHCFSGT